MRKATKTVRQGPSCFHHLMSLVLLAFLVLSLSPSALAQRPQYVITATLDTLRHIVTGTISITYTNQSSSTLDKLGIHLWPNAYKDKNSAMAKQMLRQGSLAFHNARLQDMGGLSDLNFISAEQEILLKVDEDTVDIGWLLLEKPLQPGSTIHLSSPYTLEIPRSFSRLGRTGKAYQLTQWYPHLAVFDENGWHTMTYLDQGEFFNDFADYEVRMNVPAGYTVAATGVLTSRIEEGTFTQWNFKAENVIDFAWFTSPGFKRQTEMIDVGGKDLVELNIYTDEPENPLMERAAQYARQALHFYSDWLGPYPYPQMSVVYCPLSAGGGMEYPMVAQIGYTPDAAMLDLLIAHEVGHTWLYGILANDERTYPWLDEGLNSFIERQYANRYQPGFTEEFLPAIVETPVSMPHYEALQHYTHFNHTLQPPSAAPEHQVGQQYVFSAYTLPTQGLEMMLSKEGADQMKQMFRKYYTDHRFSHVTPEDMKQSFEAACTCDLSWFFEGWIHHAHEVDYRIKKFDRGNKEITIVNEGESIIPVKINAYNAGVPTMEHWLNGFTGEKIIHLDDRADEVRLYNGFMAISRHWTTNIKPRSFIPRIGFLPKIESYREPTLGLTPVIGYNLADGFMAGVAVTSGLFPQQNFKFVIAPMYAFESKQLRGHATLRYAGDIGQGAFDKFIVSLALDDFGYNLDTHYLFRDHFVKWEPSVAFRFQPAISGQRTQWIKYRFVHIDQYFGRGINYEAGVYADEHRNYSVHELLYQLRSNDILSPSEIQANVQAGKGFLRLNLIYKQQFTGKDRHHGVWMHGYAGWLPVYDNPEATVGFTINGTASNGYFSRDYMYDQWLGGRNAVSGRFSHQVFDKDAALKTLSTIGIGEDWMIGGGVSVAMPLRYIHAYMDAALYQSGIEEKPVLSYSGGAAIVLLKDVFEIYIPMLESKDIRESLTYEVRDMWYERISFKANIKLGNPVNLIDRAQIGY